MLNHNVNYKFRELITMLVCCFCMTACMDIWEDMRVDVHADQPVENVEVLYNIETIDQYLNSIHPIDFEKDLEEQLENRLAESAPMAVVDEAMIKVETSGVEYFDVPLDEDLQQHIFDTCESYGVAPELVVAMIGKESTYGAGLIGDGGDSIGLMQIQPKWHRERMERLGVTDLSDPYQNVTVGVDYIAEILANDISVEWALMAYNGGYNYANRKWFSQGEISSYARGVLNIRDGLERR